MIKTKEQKPEKRKPLTKAQKIIITVMEKNEGSFLRPHQRGSGSRCYRLMTSDRSPVTNVREGVVSRLHNHGYLTKNDEGWLVVKKNTVTH